MSPLSQSSLHGWIHAAISRERYMLWIRDLHHWIQQRRRFMKMCESIVPTPSTLKLWAPEVNMNLACMGEFVWPYIKNITCYGHEICTIEYNKDWGLYVEALWQPHQIWSNEPLNSTIMCEFGLHGWIRVVISPEPYNLWTWIQQRWMLILCGNSVSWILFLRLCGHNYLLNLTTYGHETCTTEYNDILLYSAYTYSDIGIMFVKSAGFY